MWMAVALSMGRQHAKTGCRKINNTGLIIGLEGKLYDKNTEVRDISSIQRRKKKKEANN